MVVAAEEAEVVEVGGAAVGPVDDVVGVTPAWVSSAAGDDTVSVPGDEGPSGGGGDDPGFATDIDYFRFGVPDDAAD